MIKLYDCRPGKVRVIPGGVDLDFFRPMDKLKAKRELNLEKYSPVLLFAGRIQPIKGLDLLLSSLSQLPDGRSLKLLVVGGNSGESDEMERLSSKVKKLGISKKVEFVGAVPHEKMPVYYNAADICVIPSYHESFGLVAVECLASGTPVVASRVGGLASIIKDGETGYLVDKQSPEAIVTNLIKLLSESGLRKSMADAARSSVMKYDWSNSARKLFDVYKEVVAEKH